MTTLRAGPGGRRRIHVGMALYGDLTFDSRVRKEARSLALQGYGVTIACLAADAHPSDLPEGVHVLVLPARDRSAQPGGSNPFRVPRRGRARTMLDGLEWLWTYVSNLRRWGRSIVDMVGPVDAWHAHDMTGLAAIAPWVQGDVPIVYDSHELYLETGTALRLPGPVRRLLRRYEKHLVGRASGVITVNREIATVLTRRYRPRRVALVHNCPELWSPPDPRPDLIRAAASIPEGSPIVLYHGGLGEGRGIETLIEALLEPGLEQVHLALMGVGAGRDVYAATAREARFGGRVHLLDAVAPAALLAWVASADIGAMPNPGTTLNDLYSTPNKLFECFAAGTPVIASDFPTMRRIVMDDPAGPLGCVCDPTRVGAIAAGLRALVAADAETPGSLRARCQEAARQRWNWQAEATRLVALYEEVLPAS